PPGRSGRAESFVRSCGTGAGWLHPRVVLGERGAHMVADALDRPEGRDAVLFDHTGGRRTTLAWVDEHSSAIGRSLGGSLDERHRPEPLRGRRIQLVAVGGHSRRRGDAILRTLAGP